MFQYFDKAKFIFRCEISFWLLFVLYVFVLVTFIKEFSPQKSEKYSYYNQTSQVLQNNHFSNDNNINTSGVNVTNILLAAFCIQNWVQNLKSPEEDPVQGWNMFWNKSWNLKIKSAQFIGGYFCNIFNSNFIDCPPLENVSYCI